MKPPILWTPTEGERYTTGFGPASEWRWSGSIFGAAVALLIFLLIWSPDPKLLEASWHVVRSGWLK